MHPRRVTNPMFACPQVMRMLEDRRKKLELEKIMCKNVA